MRLPQLIDYQQAVQARTFADPALRNGRPRLTPLRQALVASGGFALIFDVDAGGRRYAVRCFHKQSPRLRERCIAVGDFVRQHRDSLDFLTDVAYVAEGIRVNGTVFPIVRMPWVDGERLDNWVERHLHEPHRLDRVRTQVTTIAARLRAAGAAHGDLQHGNILVDKTDRLRLVDYDGMFLPALANFGPSDHGHRNYQHPDRGDSYDNQLDAFAAFVIDLSLAVLTHDPALWREFNTGENLILDAEDFAAPAESEVFDRLMRIAPLADRTRRLIAACEANFAAVPAILAGERTSVRGSRSPATSRLPTGPRALDAQERATLMTHVGDHVTIVGRVAGTRIHVGDITTTAFINFGNYRDGDFTIVAFGQVSTELEAKFGKDVEALRGSWVTLSGMVTQYQSRWSDKPTPQLGLERVQTLRVLSDSEASALLAPPRPVTTPRPEPEPSQRPDPSTSGTYRWSAPPTSQPNPTADNLDRRLDQIYSARSFARPTPPPPTPPAPRAPQPYSNYRPPAPPPVTPARSKWRQRLRNWWRR